MHNTDEVRNADSHTAERAPLTVLGSNDLVRTTASNQAMNTKYPVYIHSLLFSVLLAAFTRSRDPLHDDRTDLPGTQSRKALLNHRSKHPTYFLRHQCQSVHIFSTVTS